MKHLGIKILKKLHLLENLNLKVKIFRYGFTYTLPLIRGMGYANLFLKPNWLTQLIEHININNTTFIDVGVNIGQTLIEVKNLYPKSNYIGFEPNLSCCYYIKELIKANKFKNCQVYNIALSNRKDQLYLEFDSDTDPRASVNAELRPDYFSNKEMVFALDYDSLEINNTISFVKIDVEGAELKVLEGMQKTIQKDHPLIICEVLDSFSEERIEFTQRQADEVARLLKIWEYQIVQLIRSNQQDKIIDYKIIDRFEIKQWTKQSTYSNDYLFVHKTQNTEWLKTLDQISKNN